MVFQLVPFIIKIAVSVALTVLSTLLMPKVKVDKPEAGDFDAPTADAGRPIPVLFGTKTVKGVNLLWFGEKTTKTYEV
jgi:hypothetical protein